MKLRNMCFTATASLLFIHLLIPVPAQAQILLKVGGGAGLPGSSERPVALSVDNQNHMISAVQLEVCDQDDYLTVSSPMGCETTERTAHFLCAMSELANGCARVVLFSFQGALIEQGTGPVCTLRFDVGEDASRDGCASLTVANESVSDEAGVSLSVVTEQGEFCFCVMGDVYPPGDPLDSASCGDGVVNLLDVIQGNGLISGEQEPNECQLLNGDLPSGVPPHCGSPAESRNCNADGQFDIFDLMVIIDKVLGRSNCGDYCTQ